jgi:hypothetical protein
MGTWAHTQPRERTDVPYLNLDDNYPDHPKVDILSDGAFRLHTAALCWCAKNTTDGFVEESRVPRLTRTYKPQYLAELVASAMWLRVTKGYDLHDYLDWNQSKAWWDEKREKDAKRKAAWRASHASKNEGETA